MSQICLMKYVGVVSLLYFNSFPSKRLLFLVESEYYRLWYGKSYFNNKIYEFMYTK